MKDERKTKSQLIEELSQMRQMVAMPEEKNSEPQAGKKSYAELMLEIEQMHSTIEHLKKQNPERKQTEEALRESEEKLRRMFEAITDGVAVIDLEGNFIECNDQAWKLLGHSSREDFLGRSFTDLFPAKEIERALTNFPVHFEKNTSSMVVQYDVVKADGAVIPSETSVNMLKDSEGNPFGLITISRDITERRQAENELQESKSRWESLAENAPNFIIIVNRDHKIEYINHLVSGLTFEDAIDHSIYEFISPEYHDITRKMIENVFATNQPCGYESVATGPDGMLAYYDTSAGPIIVREKIIAVSLFSTDITERKKAEAALQESEERFRLLSEAAEEGVVIHDKGTITEANEALARILRCDLSDIIGTQVFQYLTPESREIVSQHVASGYNEPYEFVAVRPDGSTFPCEGTGKSYECEGNVLRVVTLRDITDRKHAEEALLQYKHIVSSSTDMLAILDTSFTYLAANHSYAKAFGMSIDNLIGNTVSEVFGEEFFQTVIKPNADRCMAEEIVNYYDWFNFPEYGPQYMNINYYPYLDNCNNVKGFVVNGRNVTDRKLAEEAMISSEDKFSKAFHSNVALMAISTVDEGLFSEVNDMFLKTLEFDREEIIGKASADINIWANYDQRAGIIASIQEKGYAQNVDVDIRTKSGKIRNGLFSAHPIDLQGRQCLLTIMADITERKQAAEALQESEANLSRAQQIAHIGSWHWDVASNKIRWSDEMYRIYGLAREVKPSNNYVRSIIHPDDLNIFDDAMKKISENNPPAYIEYRIILPDNEEKWVRAIAELLFDDKGNLAQMFGTVQNITERKQAEEKLQRQHDLNSMLLNTLPHPVMIISADRKVLALNKVAVESGVTVGSFCWEEFGQCMFIPEKNLEGYRSTGEVPPNTFCSFCLADDCLKNQNAQNDPEVQAFEKIWDTYWIAINEEMYLHYAVDITERKQAEKALTESRSLLDKAEKIADIGGWELDLAAGGILTWTDGMRRLHDLPSDFQPTREAGYEVVHPDDFHLQEKAFKNALRTGEGYDIEIRAITAKGKEMWMRTLCEVEQTKGKVTKLRGTSQNITDRKMAQEMLQASEERMVLALKGADLAFWDWNIQSNSMVINDRWLEMIGYSSDEVDVDGDSWSSWMHPDDIPHASTILFDHLEGRTPFYSHEYRVQTKSGKWRWISDKGKVIVRDENGVAQRMAGTHMDITERKQAEEALKEREAFNYALFQHNPIATIVVDREGKVTRRNLAQKESGSRNPHVGDVMYRDFASKHEIDMHAELMECIRTGEPKEYPEMKYKNKFLSITIAPFEQGAIIISKDITMRKQTEEAAARVATLEEIEHLRKALIASVSHELRTPLTSIKGLASTLIQPDVEWDAETQKDFLMHIDQAADRLTHIVSDLVEMSQLEAGVMRMMKGWCNVNDVVAGIITDLEFLSSNHRLEINLPDDLPPVYADDTRIGEVISNLVSNAVAYSDENTRITVEARQSDGTVTVSVVDRGIGIPEDQVERVFDRFFRLDKAASRRKGGSGLGLSICKGIIDAHDGTIWAESKSGEGSRFCFSLPVFEMAEDSIAKESELARS